MPLRKVKCRAFMRRRDAKGRFLPGPCHEKYRKNEKSPKPWWAKEYV